MRTLDYEATYRKLLIPEIVGYLVQIHEKKGQQNLIIEVHKDTLSELADTAKIQSTEASNHLEGIVTSDNRLKKLVLNKTAPRNRNEREIAGYRDVLTAIHENYNYIPLRPSPILELHKDLYKYSNAAIGGRYRNNAIAAGEKSREDILQICSEPESTCLIPDAVEVLCQTYNDVLQKQDIDPLLMVPLFILDFLCIQPFADGNGRMSRLLMLLMLERLGYFIGQYISIEKLIDESKESYNKALNESSAGWSTGDNTVLPFVRYLLIIVLTAYNTFFEQAEVLTAKGVSKPNRVREMIRKTSGQVTKAQIMKKCTDISQKTVERALKEMLDQGDIIKIGGGRYTSYVWNWEDDQA